MKGEEEDLKFNLLNIEYVYRVRVFSAINLGQFMCSDYIFVTSGTKKKWPYKTGDLLEEIQCI